MWQSGQRGKRFLSCAHTATAVTEPRNDELSVPELLKMDKRGQVETVSPSRPGATMPTPSHLFLLVIDCPWTCPFESATFGMMQGE